MWIVVAAAVPLVGLLATHTFRACLESFTGSRGLIIGLFCVVLIGGEMWPIPVSRGDEAGDEITVSSTFGFGLLLIAPVLIAVVAQALALTIDGVARRRPCTRLLFNIAQYAIAFSCARVVYAIVATEPFTCLLYTSD